MCLTRLYGLPGLPRQLRPGSWAKHCCSCWASRTVVCSVLENWHYIADRNEMLASFLSTLLFSFCSLQNFFFLYYQLNHIALEGYEKFTHQLQNNYHHTSEHYRIYFCMNSHSVDFQLHLIFYLSLLISLTSLHI